MEPNIIYEGSILKLSLSDYELIQLQTMRSINNIEYINFCTKIFGLTKMNDQKEIIYETLCEFMESRCGIAWEIYKIHFINVLDQHWLNMNENEKIFSFDFYKLLYSIINDTIVSLILVPFAYIVDKRKSEETFILIPNSD